MPQPALCFAGAIFLGAQAMHGCCSFSFEYSSTTISNVWVIGLLRDHPSLLKVELPICDNSGMYAMVLTSFYGLAYVWFWTDLSVWN